MNVTSRAKIFFAVTLVALGVFSFSAFVTVSSSDWPFEPSASVRSVGNYSGPLGSLLAWVLTGLFGRVFAWLFPAVFLALGIAALAGRPAVVTKWTLKAVVVALLLNALFALGPLARETTVMRGRIGDGIAAALELVLGQIGGTVVLIAALLLLLLGEIGKLVSGFSRFGGGVSVGKRIAGGVLRGVGSSLSALGRLAGRAFKPRAGRGGHAEVEVSSSPRAGSAATADAFDTSPRTTKKAAGGDEFYGDDEAETPIEIVTAAARRRKTAALTDTRSKPSGQTGGTPIEKASLPPLTLLERGESSQRSYTKDELKNWSGILEEKLGNYGVQGRVSAVHHGPVVTTFEFEPALGVRIKDIVSRADDLALAMKARSLRMIAPIPGRAAVGIEIPNPESMTVYLYDILNEITEKQRVRGIMIATGVDVVGKPFLVNLCDAPHLLIAGTTGSGKSVCLNAIISSILFQYRPSDVKVILVDPKMVEMSVYSGIPHLLHPVITEPKEAAHVLEYLTAEMTRRNKLFRKHGVKNIESMNSKIALGKWADDEEPPERLPYMVLIVDELGDLALAKGVDIESLLARLAQTARAAGIHMVLATQRPSVDVIVGKTKANFPTRIAFRVATKVDSRTIIDTIGADKLLGKGDMLYTDARFPQPVRLHGAWVSEQDVENLTAHWKSYDYEESRIDLHAARAGSAQIDDDLDPLFEEAKGVIVRFKQGSTSLLQRKLHVGYARAARLLDQLEESGVVGPADGSKPREVYMESIEDVFDE